MNKKNRRQGRYVADLGDQWLVADPAVDGFGRFLGMYEMYYGKDRTLQDLTRLRPLAEDRELAVNSYWSVTRKILQ